MKTNGAKRKPGGQQGNLNAAKDIRPALKRLQQGKPLPPDLERVVALADREKQVLVSDRGGLDHMSGAEKLMVNNWASARKAELLIWNELIEKGAIMVTENGWDLQPGVQRLASFLMSQHRALVALGLERKQKDVMDLQTYVAEKYGGKEDATSS